MFRCVVVARCVLNVVFVCLLLFFVFCPCGVVCACFRFVGVCLRFPLLCVGKPRSLEEIVCLVGERSKCFVLCV